MVNALFANESLVGAKQETGRVDPREGVREAAGFSYGMKQHAIRNLALFNKLCSRTCTARPHRAPRRETEVDLCKSFFTC